MIGDGSPGQSVASVTVTIRVNEAVPTAQVERSLPVGKGTEMPRALLRKRASMAQGADMDGVAAADGLEGTTSLETSTIENGS